MVLRIEDHDGERSQRAFEEAMLEDLDWLGFVPDAGPIRQRDDTSAYEAAADRLRAAGSVYACDCTRATVAEWASSHGHAWSRPGCPGGCRTRRLTEGPGLTLRAALGDGQESWSDRFLGPMVGDVAPSGDLPIRDRLGNGTYPLCAVVDDLRQSITLVVRGEDLAEATPAQIRLGRRLGRSDPPVFAHHRLIRKTNGAKLSKADGDTGVRELRASGRRPEDVIGEAAAAVGLLEAGRAIAARDVGLLFDGESG